MQFEHPTHLNFGQALDVVKHMRPRFAVLVGMTEEVSGMSLHILISACSSYFLKLACFNFPVRS